MAADHAEQLDAANIARVDIEQHQVYLTVPQLPHRLGSRPALSEDGESKGSGHTVDLREATVSLILDDKDADHESAHLTQHDAPYISRTSGTAARSTAFTVSLSGDCRSTGLFPVPSIARARCRIPNTPTLHSLRDAAGVQSSTRSPGRDMVTCKQQGNGFGFPAPNLPPSCPITIYGRSIGAIATMPGMTAELDDPSWQKILSHSLRPSMADLGVTPPADPVK